MAERNVTPTVIPNPDPSVVTSDAIDRRVNNLEEVINARIDGMEKAVQVFQGDLTRVPTQLDRAIAAQREVVDARMVDLVGQVERLRGKIEARDGIVKDQIKASHDLVFLKISELSAVTTERFAGVAAQFSERDTRTDQRAGDTKLAVDAAFAAAKEATAKIESGFTKSIDEQQRLLNATTQATNDKISDLKDRITQIESRTIGITGANVDNRIANTDSSARMMAVFAVVVVIIIGIAEIVTRIAIH